MRNILLTLYIITALVLVTSCETNVVYDTYRHVSLAGWERSDTLMFDFGPIDDAGAYHENIGLRINNSYPFRSVTLIVEQTIWPRRDIRRDTVKCDLTDARGTLKGDGISCYQYSFGIPDQYLMRGDSVHVRIWHGMKREILPGISDLGFIVKR